MCDAEGSAGQQECGAGGANECQQELPCGGAAGPPSIYGAGH